MLAERPTGRKWDRAQVGLGQVGLDEACPLCVQGWSGYEPGMPMMPQHDAVRHARCLPAQHAALLLPSVAPEAHT